VAALDAVDAVWTMTSTLGFEALLRGKPVVCLGTPFYAGWGLTKDRGPTLPRRAVRPDLLALVGKERGWCGVDELSPIRSRLLAAAGGRDFHAGTRLHAAGIRVVVYTLNSDTQWDEVTALGVDGIVTDDPATLSVWQQSVAGQQ
jgi:hypothetical protein